ncbi:MAG: hypothetical protein N4A48_02695 [Tepidibacter sp.]|jgi:hypothetical protein|uniref:hypothetical protein n=1 Tax=Tepidibacter sp. TaxID=2529387 RepID=UPI0025EA78E1|nr:hypothetical protein [Tepidibacter sp.]MCT4507665.1 hypothetical protein [Tepidibacter sp.]
MRKILSLTIIFVLSFCTLIHADQFSPYIDKYIEGYIKDVLDGTVQIEEYDGTLHTLNFTDDVVYIIDNRDATLIDFKPGMEIYATLRGKKIDYIESYSTQNTGYIAKGSKVRNGTIKKIDRNQITLEYVTKDEEIFYTTPATQVTKNGQITSLNTLYVGDKVRFLFDKIDSNTVNKIEINDKYTSIKSLYRAVMKSSDDVSENVTLFNVKTLKNGKWEKANNYTTIPYNNEVPVYSNGSKIEYSDLKYYAGKTVYLVVKDFFGSEKVERMVVKDSYEYNFSDKIEDINFYSDKFELANKKNISLNDGTIIIKNSRLVDKYSINSKSDAFIVAEGRNNSLSADVVYIYNEDINNSSIGQNYIYTSKLDEIDTYSVKIEDFNVLNENEWESFDSEKDLYYDEDTYIYDLINNKQLTIDEFSSLDADHKKYYGYIYTDGDRISSIYVKNKMDSLSGQRTTIGMVESLENNAKIGWSIKIQDAKDWSKRKESWMLKKVSINVSIDKCVIIKDGKRISYEDIQVGDRIYMVRDDIYSKVLIVK